MIAPTGLEHEGAENRRNAIVKNEEKRLQFFSCYHYSLNFIELLLIKKVLLFKFKSKNVKRSKLNTLYYNNYLTTYVHQTFILKTK